MGVKQSFKKGYPWRMPWCLALTLPSVVPRQSWLQGYKLANMNKGPDGRLDPGMSPRPHSEQSVPKHRRGRSTGCRSSRWQPRPHVLTMPVHIESNTTLDLRVPLSRTSAVQSRAGSVSEGGSASSNSSTAKGQPVKAGRKLPSHLLLMQALKNPGLFCFLVKGEAKVHRVQQTNLQPQ